MTSPAFVAGDWGTSNLRLFLCGADGTLLDSRSGPGAADSVGAYPERLAALLGDWTSTHGALPVVLCGMVGSSIGWAVAPYVNCPAEPRQIVAACLSLERGRVRIIPGLACRNQLGAPDVLRGEETQILGALRLHPALSRQRQLLCLPGTHTKWAVLDAGAVSEFLTAPTGELFALLSAHSILVSDARAVADVAAISDGAGFATGLDQVARFPHISLLHRLFECRSRRLTGELAPEGAGPFLSGLLIGGDVHGAMQLLARGAQREVHIVGAARLSRLYAHALETFGYRAVTVDGDKAAREGLIHVHTLLTEQGARHEV